MSVAPQIQNAASENESLPLWRTPNLSEVNIEDITKGSAVPNPSPDTASSNLTVS